ncbi:SRPBCC family protein [Leptolyngbya sp. GGD]|uniref:SRPBCC family protein n=1 Tax=Leptolyngbya sp. GGD TaxID=2997907 RepID=UPI00227D40A8|nr:SRPBCC family protein [Leptolyngbya sp. GGD]MCY6489338.1 SRPBCC family protein [Leptolyngbya sp. GGD]
MAEYQFVTRWLIAAPIEQVWEEILNTKSWHLWWDAVDSVVDLEAGDSNGVGTVQRFVWKTPLSYTLTFNTRVIRLEAPIVMEAIAIGDVEGRGLWELTTLDRGTEIYYTWTVRTTKRWMNALAVIARPLLEWNHNIIMQQGGKGLAQWLQTELLASENVEPSKLFSKAEGLKY